MTNQELMQLLKNIDAQQKVIENSFVKSGLLTKEEELRMETDAEAQAKIDFLEENTYLGVGEDGEMVRREKEDLLPF